ncbi:hypothetical protein BKA69DRAFT_1082777 [Paraphysoderma sedebokerense]|nr:hypothetical protein BKA69DRAFT_1082721 [Paraphysoderma sedebokerense]KAI9139972.1 hypothetical protein BKA69DRAFT_1082777 [Paraphysoderma sedebokerense]
MTIRSISLQSRTSSARPITRLPPINVTAGRTTVDAPTKSSIPRPMTTAHSRLHRDDTRPSTGGNRLPPISVSNATRIGTPFIKQPENPLVESSSQSHQRTLRPQTAITFSAPNPKESSHSTHSNPRAYTSRLPRLISASTSRTSSVNHINNGKDSENKVYNLFIVPCFTTKSDIRCIKIAEYPFKNTFLNYNFPLIFVPI